MHASVQASGRQELQNRVQIKQLLVELLLIIPATPEVCKVFRS